MSVSRVRAVKNKTSQRRTVAKPTPRVRRPFHKVCVPYGSSCLNNRLQAIIIQG